jgi:hypothetical protein
MNTAIALFICFAIAAFAVGYLAESYELEAKRKSAQLSKRTLKVVRGKWVS